MYRNRLLLLCLLAWTQTHAKTLFAKRTAEEQDRLIFRTSAFKGFAPSSVDLDTTTLLKGGSGIPNYAQTHPFYQQMPKASRKLFQQEQSYSSTQPEDTKERDESREEAFKKFQQFNDDASTSGSYSPFPGDSVPLPAMENLDSQSIDRLRLSVVRIQEVASTFNWLRPFDPPTEKSSMGKD